MAKYYRRQWELFVGNFDTPFIKATNGQQFKCVFNVLVDYGGYNSYADISIYNLSKSTEAKVFKRLEEVALRAGYEDSIDFIFKGRIVNIQRFKEGPDRITQLICRGGAQELEQSTITRTLGAGSVLPDILAALANSLGFPLVINQEDFSEVKPYTRGYAMDGDPKTILTALAKTHNFRWVVENNKLVIVADGSARDGAIHQVSQFTGMEGAPQVTEVGLDVRVRLNPKIRIGGQFEVSSEFRRFNFSNLYFQDVPPSAGIGVYRIFRVQHEGDTWGDTWTTSITGLR